jgi:catechol 2,3-dioxygenase-like lactoylglutathione lyase family enzyme
MCMNFETRATIPARDLQKARQWYADKLGMTPDEEVADGLLYNCDNSGFTIYETQYAGTAQNTLMSLMTQDLDRDMGDLRANGVRFEEYNQPGLKTVNGVATMNGIRGAWFKDIDGNILSLVERNGGASDFGRPGSQTRH